ncbi:MAG: bifunctional 2-C-methyl-D-erythritol 4-phosphate cytidylyltransferase/2-C-methyl-D-erythritol 2,4-cyclodiphosphate synthase, partial [Campylobacter hyointestinalis]
MLNITLIMLGAGNSTRFGLQSKKQWLRIGNDPLWLYAAKNIS